MSPRVRVLHFSSHDEDCGVGKYQENYLVGMKGMPDIENKFFEVSPYQTRIMTPKQLKPVLDQLKKELRQFDILHIQHEFGLFRHQEFSEIVESARSLDKKVVITVHLSPGFAIKPVRRGGFGPRSLAAYTRRLHHRQRMIDYHIRPMQRADVIIAHNQVTIKSLIDFGINKAKIRKLVHPVYHVTQPAASSEIKQKLDHKPGDVIYCVVGFLHKYKGIAGAIRALKFLPDNYKLALIGGVKPDSDDVLFEDRVANLIDQLGLTRRVYITGFVPDDDKLNGLIRECDVCVFPYSGTYYSNLSSGSLNLAFANNLPVIVYPTATFREVAHESNGAVIVTSAFAYYELARELLRLDIDKQVGLSKGYAEKVSWPKMSKQLSELYKEIIGS